MARTVHPLIRAVARSRPFARWGPRVLPRVDLAVARLTAGRVIPSQLMFTSLVLTTRGSRTGLPREVPLLCFPHGGSWYVVASNWGRPHHPAWSTNLLREPRAEVVFRGRVVPVVAHLLQDEDEVAAARAELVRSGAAPVYDRYAARSGRTARLFRLTPV
ncbi:MULTISPECIES: nitroreductase/quinone reductase family protein [unclassified Saccharothrix]|uniref:nitroreductase/quinone reductase family protein n=1 Tax=unclassified Saccharothrix TaxID=2593673 RepID=UPI00307FC7BF